MRTGFDSTMDKARDTVLDKYWACPQNPETGVPIGMLQQSQRHGGRAFHTDQQVLELAAEELSHLMHSRADFSLVQRRNSWMAAICVAVAGEEEGK